MASKVSDIATVRVGGHDLVLAIYLVGGVHWNGSAADSGRSL